jgi:signal transduction histidine kinase
VRTDGGSDAEQGTGLGLAIVAAIAEAHDGDVRVISQPADGATFVVRIPVERAVAPEDALPPMPVDTDGRT